METQVERHLEQARRDAERLLLQAEPPLRLRLATVGILAVTLFVFAVAAGFSVRIAEIESVERGDPLSESIARQQARQQWRLLRPVTTVAPMTTASVESH